jgi:hypothetical protein
MRTAIAVILCLSLLVGGCTGVKKSQGIKPGEKKGGFLGLAKKSDVEVSGEKSVKGETKVVIPFFRIGFFTEKNPKGYQSQSTSIRIFSGLMGVENPTFQAIADRAYDDFVARMTERGFEVLAYDRIAGTEAFAKMTHVDSPHVAEGMFEQDAVYFAPSGMRLVLPMQKQGIGGAFDTGNPVWVTGGLLKEMNVAVVNLTYYVDYLSQADEKFGFITTGLGVGQTVMVTPGSGLSFSGYEASLCKGFCPDAVANLKLGQPVFSTKEVGDLKDMTRTGDKVGDYSKMALSWMTSGLKVHGTKRYELHADPEKYKQVAIEVIARANGQIVDALAAAM